MPKDSHGSGSRHRIEWMLAGLGALIICGSVGFLGYKAWTDGDGPPAIQCETLEIRRVPTGYVVEIKLRNEGAATAAQLKIVGELIKDNSVIESGEAVFDYVPAGSTRSGGLFFLNDPRAYQLRIHPEGYQRP
jgi:uncharacterized protein (TIGR02588 family)